MYVTVLKLGALGGAAAGLVADGDVRGVSRIRRTGWSRRPTWRTHGSPRRRTRSSAGRGRLRAGPRGGCPAPGWAWAAAEERSDVPPPERRVHGRLPPGAGRTGGRTTVRPPARRFYPSSRALTLRGRVQQSAAGRGPRYWLPGLWRLCRWCGPQPLRIPRQSTADTAPWPVVASAAVGISLGEPALPAPVSRHRRAWYESPLDPEGVLMDASDQPLFCMSVHGSEVVVGGSDHGLKVFDSTSGRLVRTLYSKRYGHSEWVTCVKHLPDGRVLSAAMDNKLCLWSKGVVRCSDLEGHRMSVSALEVNAEGTYAVSGSYDKTLRVWSTAGAGSGVACLRGHQAPVLKLAIGSGDVLASGDRSGHAMLWDLRTGQQARELPGHRGHITAVEPLPDGGGAGNTLFMTGAQDGAVKVWDPRSRPPVASVTNHVGAVNDVMGTRAAGEMADAMGGQLVVSAGADKVLNVLDPRASFSTLHRIEDHKDFVYSLCLHGCLALSGGGDGILLVHDLVDGAMRYGLGANMAAVRCIHASAGQLVAAGDDGKAIAYSFA